MAAPHDPNTEPDAAAGTARFRGTRGALDAAPRPARPLGPRRRWRPLSGSLLVHGVIVGALAWVGVGLASAPAAGPSASHAVVADVPDVELREVAPPPLVAFPRVDRAPESNPSEPTEPFQAFAGPLAAPGAAPEAVSADPLVRTLRHDARLPGSAHTGRSAAPTPGNATSATAGASPEQQPSGAGATATDAPPGRTSNARATRRTPPRYPTIARRRGWEGTAIVIVQLDASGGVTGARLARTSGRTTLDDVALTAVEDWEFEPAYEQGRAVASELTVSVEFRLTAR